MLDFVCGLIPVTQTRHTACLVVIDRFTRIVWLLRYKNYLSSKEIVILLFTHVVAYYGLPMCIVSDGGVQFESTL